VQSFHSSQSNIGLPCTGLGSNPVSRAEFESLVAEVRVLTGLIRNLTVGEPSLSALPPAVLWALSKP